jgi:hypothetical protein
MITSKTAFIIIIAFLCIIVFPYYIAILLINSDFLSSIIPGWNTNIVDLRIVSNLIKFLVLSIVSFYYWKLSKNTENIDLKKFTIHLSLTLPAILAGNFNVYKFVEMNLYNPESFLSQIKMVIYINTFINILFFSGQILFWIFYVKFQKKITFSAIKKLNMNPKEFTIQRGITDNYPRKLILNQNEIKFDSKDLKNDSFITFQKDEIAEYHFGVNWMQYKFVFESIPWEKVRFKSYLTYFAIYSKDDAININCGHSYLKDWNTNILHSVIKTILLRKKIEND